MRAVSVPITPTSGNSGLIFPGDRVDLILTQTLITGDGEGSTRRVSETVLNNIRIIAMGAEIGDDRRGQGQREGQDRHPRGHAGPGRRRSRC